MNWPKEERLNLKIVLGIFCWVFISGCGVKGDPLPPEKPVDLGRGRPTYKRATEGIRIENSKKSAEDDDEDEDEDDSK